MRRVGPEDTFWLKSIGGSVLLFAFTLLALHVHKWDMHTQDSVQSGAETSSGQDTGRPANLAAQAGPTQQERSPPSVRPYKASQNLVPPAPTPISMSAKPLPSPAHGPGSSTLIVAGDANKVVQSLASTAKPLPRACSPLRQADRSGSVIHDMAFAWAFALSTGMQYIGPVGKRSDLPDIPARLKLFGVPWKMHRKQPEGCTMLQPAAYRKEDVLKEQLPRIRTEASFKPYKTSNCVVHLRRGDVTEKLKQTGDYFRWWPAVHYLRMIDKHCGNRSVVLHTESFQNDEEKIFKASGAEIKIRSSVLEATRDFVSADILIMSSSSFSYNAAIFSRGRVVYAPFWHKALTGWSVPRALPSIAWDDVQKSFSVQTLPCEGGQFGSHIGPSISVCMMTPKTTVLSHHMPHAAQTMFNCWSLFQHHATDKCAFNFQGVQPTAFITWLAHRMGCAIQVSGKQCMHVSHFVGRLGVGPGETFSWFNSQEDAERLRAIVFRQIPYARSKHVSSTLGILQRRASRRLVLPSSALANGMQVAYMEDLDFDGQVSWWNAHEIIVASHGAALWAAPFARKCTVVVQLYPTHYYPIRFFEVMIAESGSVPVSWWPGAYLGDDIALRKQSMDAADADFKAHLSKRGAMRAADIAVSDAVWKQIIAVAQERRTQCLGMNATARYV